MGSPLSRVAHPVVYDGELERPDELGFVGIRALDVAEVLEP